VASLGREATTHYNLERRYPANHCDSGRETVYDLGVILTGWNAHGRSYLGNINDGLGNLKETDHLTGQ
jgi:hypothetical protein